jgi:putative OmpL-like beta-barrel porin-2
MTVSATNATADAPDIARLSVHVVATTAEGTRSALLTAKRLVDGLDAHADRRSTPPRIGPRREYLGFISRVCRRVCGRSAGGRACSEARSLVVMSLFTIPSRPRDRVTMRSLAGLVMALGVTSSASAQPPSSPAEGTAPQASAAQPSAQSAPGPFDNVKFGVTLEGYYQYDWNRPPDRALVLRAYDTRANVFSIQQAAIIIESAPNVESGRRFGARLDLQFGQATDTVQGSPANEPRPEVYRNVWQAFGTYVFPVGKNGLQVDFGKYASMLGYETNYAKDNQAFSRAYLFNFLPFYHSGLRVMLPVTEKVSVLYMLSNGIQQTEDFNDFKSSHFAAIVKPTPKVTWVGNYYVGQEQPDGGEPGGPDGVFKVFDTNVAVAATPALSVALDFNYVTNEINRSDPSLSLQGTGAYARYQVTPASSLGIRYERLDDEGLFGGIDQVLQEATVTGEYKLAEGFLARAEFRRDWSNQRFFPGRLGARDPRDHQNTLLIGGVWWFGNKQGGW